MTIVEKILLGASDGNVDEMVENRLFVVANNCCV